MKKKARPGRSLLTLAVVIVALVGAIFAGSFKDPDASFIPKLALDLEGGTQLILTPKTTDGSTISDEDINQAIEIIRQRVDASGVAEAEITRQGQSNIVVALPGQPSDETLDLVRKSAVLRFRPVLTYGDPAAVTAADIEAATSTADTDEDSTEDTATADSDADPVFSAADTDGDGVLSTEPTTEPTDNSDTAWITEQVLYDYYTLDCTDESSLVGGDDSATDQPLVTCSDTGDLKFILGPVDIEGTHITGATSGLKTTSSGAVTNQWQVSLEFDSEGADQFADVTARLAELDSPRNQFAVVLDGLVISYPSVSKQITGGSASISGTGITKDSAATLANQLQFGSLPLNFEVQSEEQISATLGIQQLERGLLAGLVGLALIVIYMLFQYHALAGLTLASLLIAATLSYLSIAVLSWTVGYRLSLAGVAGLIVAIGITADSFIVYFERIRDEVREGRLLTDSVEYGWLRARRTIFASDAVSFLAAIVLYFLAVGGVRGFAFTLGLTTFIDLVVVILFTHPMMQLLVRTKYFGEGRKFSGLDPRTLGASTVRYRAAKRTETIAERKAAQQAAAASKEVEL